MHDLTGQQLGKYRLQYSLGAGGHARVYLGEHIHLKTTFAVKVLEEVMDQDAQAQFLAEAQRIAGLRHPNIVAVTDFDVVNSRAFLVLEFAPYGTPKHTAGVPMDPHLVASYIKQIAAALQYIHDEKRLVHCDVKPANMLLWENKHIKLSDFGITQLARGTDASTLLHIEGTAAYMAPEHWKGKFVFATDQYSLGIVAYQWLAGDLPFHGSHADLQRQHAEIPPPPLHRLNSAISMSVEQVINRALQKSPQQRYPRITDFAQALENALKYTPHAPRRSQQEAHVPAEGSIPPLLMHEHRHPNTAPNPLVLASPTSNNFHAHVDPTIQGSVNSPLPATPLSADEPEMPLHELMLEQQQLVRHFVDTAQEQEARKNAIMQQHTTARQEAAAKRKQDLVKTDDDLAHIRHYKTEMGTRLKQQGWRGLARKFQRNPFAFITAATPSQQIREYRQEADADYEVVDDFLRRYAEPSELLKTSQKLAIICTVLVGIVWSVFVQGLLHWNVATFIVLALLLLFTFVGVAAWFSITTIARMGKAYYHLKQLDTIAGETQQLRRQIIEEEYQQRLERIEQAFLLAMKQLTQELLKQLPARQAEVDDFKKKLGFAGLSWTSSFWQEQWQSRRTNSPRPPVTRIGKLVVNSSADLPALPSIPAVISSPHGANLLLEAAGAAKSVAISAALSFILRLLLVQPPGHIHFTFIDPTRLGRNFDPFLWLTEHPDILVTGNVLSTHQEIEQHLAELMTQITRITQLQSRSLKEVTEPYRVLVVIDFPAGFTAEAARRLLAIAQNGPRCGISSIVVVDEARSLQVWQDFEMSTLEQLATVIRWDEQRFVLQSEEMQDCHLELDRLPEEGLYRPLLHVVQQSIRASSSVEQHPGLQELFAQPTWLPQHQAAKIGLGVSAATKELLMFSFRRQSANNLLIVGKQGDFGTGMLLMSLMGIAAQQSPDRAQFAILDLSMTDMSKTYGPEIQPFSLLKSLLPSYTIQVVNRRNWQSTLPTLLASLRTTMKSRRLAEQSEQSSLYLFICGMHRLNDLSEYAASDNQKQPGENQLADATLQLLQTILRNGPEFGIHTLAWCDTFKGLENVLVENSWWQFDIRVVFPTLPGEEISKLVEHSGLPNLSSGQAFYFNRDDSQLERFRPFPPPSKAWLQEVAQRIQKKT